MNEESLTNWQNNIKQWNKGSFISEVCDYLSRVNNTDLDRHAIAMLAESIDTFVRCTIDIEQNGLVVTHKNGVTGKNHHVDIRDKALSRSLSIMSELGLTPKRRKALPTAKDIEFQKWLKGPFS